MINRLQLFRNIGVFDSVDTAANIELGRLTLIYAENGRGKTTLCAVLRSLATGDPLPIVERRRLSAANPPHVVLDCDGGPAAAMFQNGAWNRTVPDIAVFDDLFIDENVCSGLAVDPEHRQNLHELILGAQGVALNRQLQSLVDRIEGHNRELRSKGAAIPAGERGSLSVDQFCALPVRHDVDAAIQAAEQRLAAARQQDAIRDGRSFDEVAMPSFEVATLQELLSTSLPSLDAAAAARVQAHLAVLGEGAETWVADGMQRVAAEASGPTPGGCPFCAQSLASSPVLTHYRAYFSDGYRQLKRSVSDKSEAIGRAHAGDVLAAFERWARITTERHQFWASFCNVPDVTVDTAAIARDWRSARESVAAVLAAKQAAPLEAMALTPDALAAVGAYEVHRQALVALNGRLQQEANTAIRLVKEQAATSNARVLEADLGRLKAAKARHSPTIAPLCEAYVAEQTAKEVTERSRDQTRRQLDRHRAAVFPAYQAAINMYLQRFNAGFRLDSVTAANTRAGSTCTYNVLVNNIAVPVAGGGGAPGQPSFRNTLSAGDRNTLALAFFFASLDQDPALQTKTVVIDDPISSLDEHREVTTVQQVRRLAERAAQMIVLSHSKPFLCRIWDGADATGRCALEVRSDGQGVSIREWDVRQDCITEHDRRHAILRAYLAHGSPDNREVAEAIRPVLEGFIRVAYPEHFPPGALLGSFLGLCGARVGTPEQILDPVDLAELRDVVEYANRFHHEPRAAWETQAINSGELTGFVRRTLNFAKRAPIHAVIP